MPAKSYICNICGYVYNPRKGDKIHGVPKDTAFSKLRGWRCPECGVGKSEFKVKLEEDR